MKLNRIVIAALVAICAFVACKKGYDTVTTKSFTNVNFINATADTVNLYVNGSRVNTTNALYPLGSSGYLSALLGEQNYQVRKAGKPDVLFSLPVPLDKGKVYSFFLAGNTAEQAFVDVDTLSSAASKSTLIRFVHTSPNVGSIDVVVNDTLYFANKAFKSISDFMPIGVGPKNILVFKAGADRTTATPISTAARILTSGSAYTIFTKSGLSATGKNAIPGIGIVVNR